MLLVTETVVGECHWRLMVAIGYRDSGGRVCHWRLMVAIGYRDSGGRVSLETDGCYWLQRQWWESVTGD